MGMYTEIYVNVDFKEDTPEDVIKTIRAVCNGNYEHLDSENRPSRWGMLFGSGSYYTPNTEASELTYDYIGKQYSLLGKGDIKNYEEEIEQFFEFITPWVASYSNDIPYFMGYTRYEEWDMPRLVYKHEGKVNYLSTDIGGTLNG